MAKQEDLAAGFRNLDQASDPGAAVRYLSTINMMEALQAARRFEHSLLGVQAGHRVLDVGCGLGDDVRALGERVGESGKAVGVDSSEKMLAEAKKRQGEPAPQVEYRLGDAHRLEFADGTFDGCRASRVFHYLEDPHMALAEMIRVTRRDGTIVISEPETDCFVIDASDRRVTRQILHFWCDSFRNGWIGRQLPGLFRDLGLTDVSVTPMATNLPFAVLDHFGLRRTAEQAAEAGIVSPAEAADWWRYLEQADQAGRFVCTALTLYVRGRKP